MNKYSLIPAALSLLIFSGCCWFSRGVKYSDFNARFTGERTELYYQGEKWTFARFLQLEIERHPEMECADLVKFCCQAAFGSDHANPGKKQQFSDHFAALEPDQTGELIRVTSPDTARVNIAAWKAAGLPAEWLFRMSVMEGVKSDGEDRMREYLTIAETVIPESGLKFTAEEFRKFADAYLKSNHMQQQHSPAYRAAEPDYRVISSRFFHSIPVLKLLAARKTDQPTTIVAIDGRAASGKTTLAKQLKIILDAQIIHMDDFFLPPAMRTQMRYETAGGNIHYERFKEEVLPQLKKNNAFSYRIFDCKKNAFNGSRMIWKSPWIIVEGAYSTHPIFGDYADVKIFYDITKTEQLRRIFDRNGAAAAKTFQDKWIPLEENYINTFKVDQKADLILK